jgi:CheY-like chemotaxis protein
MSAADAEAMEELTAMGSGVNVLVVDDNSDAADLAATVLTDAGHRVEVAYSGLEALERVAGWHPDVVVLDIGLPDLDGYQIAAELRSRHPERVFQMIALTGYGQSHDRTRSAAAGFAAHLVKPVDPVQLSAAVGRLAGAAEVEARPPV